MFDFDPCSSSRFLFVSFALPFVVAFLLLRSACAFDARVRAKTALAGSRRVKTFRIFRNSRCAFDARGAQSCTYVPMPDPVPLILSIGTQVVSLVEVKGPHGKPVHPRGAVGVIVQSPGDYWHAYRVRFPDDFEASLRRQELAVLAHYKSGVIGSGA